MLRQGVKPQKRQNSEGEWIHRNKGRWADGCIERYGEATLPCYGRWEQTSRRPLCKSAGTKVRAVKYVDHKLKRAEREKE